MTQPLFIAAYRQLVWETGRGNWEQPPMSENALKAQQGTGNGNALDEGSHQERSRLLPPWVGRTWPHGSPGRCPGLFPLTLSAYHDAHVSGGRAKCSVTSIKIYLCLPEEAPVAVQKTTLKRGNGPGSRVGIAYWTGSLEPASTAARLQSLPGHAPLGPHNGPYKAKQPEGVLHDAF